jgi:hypothetical protein
MINRLVSAFNLLTMGTVSAINALDTQFWAIIVLCIGCAMLIGTKHWGIDTTVAGGVIGVASNMLTGQIKKALTPPTTPAPEPAPAPVPPATQPKEAPNAEPGTLLR